MILLFKFIPLKIKSFRNLGVNSIFSVLVLVMTLITLPTISQSFDFNEFEVRLQSPYQKVFVNQQNVDLVKQTVAGYLEADGMHLATPADYLVNITMVIEEEVQTRDSQHGDFVQSTVEEYGTKAIDDGITWQQVIVGVYKVGTINIEMVNSLEGTQVWQGSRTTVLWQNKEKKIRRKIDRSIRKIMNKFEIPA